MENPAITEAFLLVSVENTEVSLDNYTWFITMTYVI